MFDPIRQLVLNLVVETAPPQIALHPIGILLFRHGPQRPRDKQDRGKFKLRTEVIEDAHRRGLPTLEQSSVAAQHAQLQREMPAVFVAAALRSLAFVGFRQGPMPRQFFLAWILWQ